MARPWTRVFCHASFSNCSWIPKSLLQATCFALSVVLISLTVAVAGIIGDRHQSRRSSSGLLFDRHLSLKQGGGGDNGNGEIITRQGRFQVLETVPHDKSAFTEGLVLVQVQNGSSTVLKLYEGTGLYGKSQLRQVDLLTGQVLQQTPLASKYFGEGIAYYNIGGQSRIVQLTWKEKTAFIYDSNTLTLLSSFTFTTTNNQGWGITYRPSASSFIVSDGSTFLHSWDQTTWEQTNRVQVTMNRLGSSAQPVDNLNELEWDPSSDTILANVWTKDWILRISPDTGFVKMLYDLSSLFPDRPTGSEAVLNGIAMVPGATDQVWVTGKLWPFMFRIRLMDKN